MKYWFRKDEETKRKIREYKAMSIKEQRRHRGEVVDLTSEQLDSDPIEHQEDFEKRTHRETAFLRARVRPGYWVMLAASITLLLFLSYTQTGCATIPNEPDTVEFKIAKGFGTVTTLADLAADLYTNDLISYKDLRWAIVTLETAHNALVTASGVIDLDLPSAQVHLSVALNLLKTVQEFLDDERPSNSIKSSYRTFKVADGTQPNDAGLSQSGSREWWRDLEGRFKRAGYRIQGSNRPVEIPT